MVLIVFIYQPVKVEGTSMEPGLTDNERIFINKFTYKLNLGDVRRGDTVVFWYPRDTTKSYIKRVVGLPGDRIRIDARTSLCQRRGAQRGICRRAYRDLSTWADGREVTVPLMNISCWAITATHRATAGLGDMCRANEHLRQGCFCLLAPG